MNGTNDAGKTHHVLVVNVDNQPKWPRVERLAWFEAVYKGCLKAMDKVARRGLDTQSQIPTVKQTSELDGTSVS